MKSYVTDEEEDYFISLKSNNAVHEQIRRGNSDLFSVDFQGEGHQKKEMD